MAKATRCASEHLFMSTIAKTWRSYIVAVIGAEKIVKCVPPGTLVWDKFIRYEVLKRKIEIHGFSVFDAMDPVYQLGGYFEEFSYFKDV